MKNKLNMKLIAIITCFCLIVFASVLLNRTKSTVESVDLSTIKEIYAFIDDITASIATEDYSNFTKNVYNSNSAMNPIFNNSNGYGVTEIGYLGKLTYSEEEFVQYMKKYIEILFGANAWNNVTISSIYNIYGPYSESYWINTTDNAHLTDLEYAEASNQFWANVMKEHGLESRMTDMSDPDVIQAYSDHLSDMPFKQVLVDDPNLFIVRLDFNGLSIAPTGEGQFYLTLQKYDSEYRIWQSFTSDDPLYRTTDKAYNTIIDNEGTFTLTIGSLTSNVEQHDPAIKSMTDEFVTVMQNQDIDWIYNHIIDRSTIWSPGTPDLVNVDEKINSGIQRYLEWDNNSASKIDYFIQKIGCLNYSGYNGQVWINTATNEYVSETEAERINNEYFISKCAELGVVVDEDKANYGFGDEEIEILTNNNVTPQYYPIQPIFSYVNPYDLYKVTLFREDEQVNDQKYFSFYISNQKGNLEVISSISYEAIYDCSISVQGRGD